MKSTVVVFVSALILIYMAPSAPALSNPGAARIEKLAEGLQGSEVQKETSQEALLSALSSSKEPAVSEKTKSIIEAEFLKEANRETVLLAGLAGVDSVLEQIREIAEAPISAPEAGRFFGTKEWAANLIITRNGDHTAANKLIEFAKTQDLHTQVVFVAVDMKYAPHPRVVEYLAGMLDSNERLEPVKPTVKGMPVANYAASSLAKMLKNFPVDYREDYSYSPKEIEACRDWMAAQKELNFR